MEKFITEYIEPLLLEGPVPEANKEAKLSMLQGELKILLSMTVKTEMAAVKK